jgi:nucleotide-binding universal stress UspA family protein
MKVLVGVDQSTFSGDVLKAIVRQFRAEDTEIRVLHVLQPIAFEAPPQMGMGYIPELEEEKQPALDLVARAAKELVEVGFKVDTAVIIGDVRETLIDSAAEWKADLIVVGSHGQRGLARFLIGSVAEFVARHAACSVQIVRSAHKA